MIPSIVESRLPYGKRAIVSAVVAELYRHTKPFTTLLALILTALIVFVIANSFPIVKIELQATYPKPLYWAPCGYVSLRWGICRCSYFNYYIHCATYVFVIAGLCTRYGQYIKEMPPIFSRCLANTLFL